MVQSWVILSDFAKYLMTWSIARYFCDSWASCQKHRALRIAISNLPCVVNKDVQIGNDGNIKTQEAFLSVWHLCVYETFQRKQYSSSYSARTLTDGVNVARYCPLCNVTSSLTVIARDHTSERRRGWPTWAKCQQQLTSYTKLTSE